MGPAGLVAGLDVVPVVGGRTIEKRQALPLPQLAGDRCPGAWLSSQIELRGGDGGDSFGSRPGRRPTSDDDRDDDGNKQADHVVRAAPAAASRETPRPHAFPSRCTHRCPPSRGTRPGGSYAGIVGRLDQDVRLTTNFGSETRRSLSILHHNMRL